MAFSVSYSYIIHDRYSSKLAKIRRATDRYTRGMTKARNATKKFGAKLSGMQSTLSSVAGALGGTVALGVYNKFETQMNKLASVALTSEENILKLRNAAKQMGEVTQFSATQAAAGMEKLKLAGLSVNEILKAIPSTLQLAAAGSFDMATAADIATGVMGGMELKIKDLVRINDVLALAQSKARFDMAMIAEAFIPVANTAAKAGVSLEELTATLGILAEGGLRGSLAGTMLMNAFLKVRTATKGQSRIYRRLGVDLKKYLDKQGMFTDFVGFIEKFKELQALGKLTPKVYKKLFDIRGLKAMQILFGKTKISLRGLTGQLEKAGGTAEKMAKIQMRGLPGVFKLLKSVAEALVIVLFESGLDKWLQRVGFRIIDLIKRLKNSNPAILKFVAALGAFLVVSGPLLLALGMIVTGVGALMTPVVGVIALFAVVAGAAWFLKGRYEKLDRTLSSLGKSIRDILGPFRNLLNIFVGLKELGEITFFDILAESLNAIANALKFILSPLRAVMNFGTELSKGNILGAFGAAFEAIRAGSAALVPEFIGVGGTAGSVSTQSQSAQNAVMKGSLSGRIDITTRGAVERVKAELTSSLPGNLGLNMQPQGSY